MTEYRVVDVQSNVDRLSVRAINRLLSDLVERVAKQGEEVMRELAPKDTGLMASKVAHKGPDRVGDVIHAEIGIPHISEANAKQGARRPYFPGEQDSGDYPLFKARGTGIFGPASAPIHPRRAKAMRFEGADGNPIFRSSVKGSPASHFLLETYEGIHSALLPADAKIFAVETQHLYLVP